MDKATNTFPTVNFTKDNTLTVFLKAMGSITGRMAVIIRVTSSRG